MAAASDGLGFHSFRKSALACVALVVSIAVAAPACGPLENTGPGGAPSGGAGGGAGDGGDGGDGGGVPCPEGSSRSCKIDLGQQGQINSCFEGVQRCEDGVWGTCVDPAQKPAPPPSGGAARRPSAPDSAIAQKAGSAPEQHVLSLSSAAACGASFPCDPSCQNFDEVPGTPLSSPPEILIADWQTGSSGALPTAIANQGLAEPCNEGEDCQFDQYCNNPTSGTCSHSKCATGAGLNAACDSCVSKICALDPSCCNTPLGTTAGSTCAHDLCVTGGPLKGSPGACDPCVATICSNPQFPFCCSASGQWTGECVNQVTALCGKSCATGSWTQSCVDKVKTTCGAFCLEDTAAPICEHDPCYIGAKLDSACDPCVASVCLADSFCCTGSWDGKCLQEVATICGKTCPKQGDCTPWLPTQTDPDCIAVDLTVGVGCTTGGVPQVPVCNHGQTTAPANIPVAVFPPSPPGADIIPSGNYVAEPLVFTPSAIEPGDCVNVSLGPVMADVVEGAQIYVNPKNAPDYINSECAESNNFAVWSAATGACATPSCAGASASAKLKKVKLFFAVDISKSQTDNIQSGLPGSPTRWAQVKDALTGFFQDPGSNDLAVWMRFWPLNSPGACPAAYSAGCSSVATNGCTVANADVPNLNTVANENTLITALNGVTPLGQTPMYPALDGALKAATTFQQANADYTAAVVLVTDGNPTQCTTSSAGMSSLTASYFNGYGVRTYVIGIADVSQVFCELVAGSGGGKSFFISAGVNVQVKNEMISALGSIKQDFVSCSLALPNQDIFDPTKATFTYTPGVGAPINLMNVGNSGACGAGNGWYYDNPADPTSITLCPATCTAVKNDVNGKLELSIDCISQYEPFEPTPEIYEATCPPGTVPQWSFLTYDTTIPGDSQVEFRVSTSTDGVTFDALPALATATATAAAPDCVMGGPMPCPINLYSILGLPKAHRKYLQLAMKVFPTSDQNQTPQVNSWEVKYSCPDAE